MLGRNGVTTLGRPWSRNRRKHVANSEVVRCDSLFCEEPDGGIWVSSPVTLYINARGVLMDQGDVEWSDGDTASCSSCEEEGVYSDFVYFPTDFLIFPRSLKDLDEVSGRRTDHEEIHRCD